MRAHDRYRIVLDTNVFIAALRSRSGASSRLLSLTGTGRFELVVSVPLVLEYEAVAKREEQKIPYAGKEIDRIIDFICNHARRQPIHFLWRPILPDSKDDAVLEAAVAAHCDCIVTYNRKDFLNAREFGLDVVNARQVLQKLGELP